MDEKRIVDEWNNRCVSVSGGFNVAYYNDYHRLPSLDVFKRVTVYRCNY